MKDDQTPPLRLRVGDLVEVRSEQEILATLDEQGTIEGMPFMPEMLEYCGKRFRVDKRADKTCNTITVMESRRIYNAVYLEGLRCNGAAHGGYQAQCFLFWKEAWLKRVGTAGADSGRSPTPGDEHLIDERTGKMLTLPGEWLILEGVICGSRYSERRLFSPRSLYSFWREIWLKRVEKTGIPG